MRRRTAAARLAAGLFVFLVAARSPADDKDLLVRASAPSNLMIVFGNSQTTEQPILGSSSARAALSQTVASCPASRNARASEASVFASSSTISRCAKSEGTTARECVTASGFLQLLQERGQRFPVEDALRFSQAVIQGSL